MIVATMIAQATIAQRTKRPIFGQSVGQNDRGGGYTPLDRVMISIPPLHGQIARVQVNKRVLVKGAGMCTLGAT